MKNYRKKPIVIKAWHFTGEYDENTYPFHNDKRVKMYFDVRDDDKITHLVIETLEGNHYAKKGDYIITGVKGELYPCKPDIFKMTYEEVEL